MKKVVLKLDLHDDKSKQKAMKTVSSLTGVESIAVDMKERKLTVIGDVDPVNIVSKLRKGNWHTDIITVGPAKEEKKEEGKKEEGKKEEGKKEEGKKDEGNKKEDEKKKQEQQIADLVNAYKAYNPYLTQHYHVVSVEENPNACVIC